MQPLTVTIAGITSPKQQDYIDALLGQINAKLQELAPVAPRSTEAVAAEYRQALTMPHTSASMMIDRLKTIADSDLLGRVYQQAERVLRDNDEKAALMPLRQAAADAFRAIPVAGQRTAPAAPPPSAPEQRPASGKTKMKQATYDAINAKIAAIESDPLAWAKQDQAKRQELAGGTPLRELSDDELREEAAYQLDKSRKLIEGVTIEQDDIGSTVRANERTRRAIERLES